MEADAAKKRKFLGVVAAALLFVNGSAIAAVVTYNFSGSLTDIRGAGAGFSYGDAFLASYVHDDNTQIGSPIELGRIGFSGGQFTIGAAGRSFVGPSRSELQVFDDWTNAYGGYYADDGFFVTSYLYDPGYQGFYLIQFDLWDLSGATLASLAVPDQHQLMQLAQNGRVWIRRFDDGVETGLASGTFRAFSPLAEVPLPSSLALLGFGLSSLGFLRRRKLR